MNRPIALVCYICGREFGTKSLAIHIKTCEKKWEQQESLKPPKQRRPCPQPPQGLSKLLEKKEITKNDIINMNSNAFDTYMEQALVQCQYCGRKFNENSLKPHQKACAISPMLKKTTAVSKISSQGPSYGSQIKQDKKYEQEFQKPIKVPSKGYNLSNIETMQGGNQKLEQCYKCGRTFANDRIAKHQKVCKGESVKVAQKQAPPPPAPTKKGAFQKPGKDPKWKIQHQEFQNAMKYMKQMKKVQQQGGKITDLPPPPKGNYDHYVQCKYCGRKYAQDVAERHIPKCKDIINKPGGIKPSQIQSKYVGGSGVVQPIKPKPSVTNMTSSSHAYKPTMSVTKPLSIPKTTASYVKPPSPMKSSIGQTSNQQYGKMFKR